MENLEWKDDPSPLQMLEEGESACVGEWELRVDRMKPFTGLDGVIGSLRAGMTEREREVLDMRFGLGDGEDSDDEYVRKLEEQKRRRKEGEKSHQIHWKIAYKGDGTPRPFSHMGGQAGSKEEGKALAERALGTAMMAKVNLEGLVE